MRRGVNLTIAALAFIAPFTLVAGLAFRPEWVFIAFAFAIIASAVVGFVAVAWLFAWAVFDALERR